MSERNDELTRLSYTLGENMEDRFYVYMLQDDNGKPFYIGKGQGGRVFCHENDADMLLELYAQKTEIEMSIIPNYLRK